MGVSIVDGTIEEAVLKKARQNLRVYQYIKFRQQDGETMTVAKPIADASVAELLTPGTSGRFYLFTQIDHRGIHGVRTSDGREVGNFPKNNEKAMIIVGVAGLVMLALSFAIDRFNGWGLICVLLGFPGYVLYRATRITAERQFAEDGNRPMPLITEPART
jgi:hypothetical protein